MIKANKFKEIALVDNTAFLITTPNEIIIDSNNEKGKSAIIFDLNLVQQTKIFFHKENLDIYSFFKKFSNGELIFYCPEDHCLVHINLHNTISKIISLDTSFNSIIFSPVYLWESDKLIVSDYKKNFYTINLDNNLITPEKASQIKKNNQDFYNLCEAVFSKNTQTIYPNLYQYIFKDDSTKTITWTELNGPQISIPNICPSAHDYEYRNDIFLLISENEIAVGSAVDKEVFRISLEKPYIFLRASFLDDYSFVVLSRYQNKNKLTIYTLSNET